MEKKTRKRKLNIYYYIDTALRICVATHDMSIDDKRFKVGNYFPTKEEAESTARKLRAVLNGADIIETPSDKDIENAMKTSVTESIMCVYPFASFTPKATDIEECAWIKGAEWVKSKIIK